MRTRTVQTIVTLALLVAASAGIGCIPKDDAAAARAYLLLDLTKVRVTSLLIPAVQAAREAAR